jgi:hypothetical protein
MLAQAKTCGVAIAQRSSGVEIPEKGVATTLLNNLHDVHFGYNGAEFNGKVANVHLWGLGPRILDISKRGGRTAEDTWRWAGKKAVNVRCTNCNWIDPYNYQLSDLQGDWQDDTDGSKVIAANKLKCKQCKIKSKWVVVGLDPARKATVGFEGYFTTFNQQKQVTKTAFPTGAHKDNKLVEGQDKGFTGPTKDKCSGTLYGVRWSKTALEHVAEQKTGKVHFHLDGMGDISKVLDKSGGYAYNVTGSELRYVYRNWTRFSQYTVFYNGYTAADEAVIVEKPWDKDYTK